MAVDQRGHGRSDQAEDGYDTATCAADLVALSTELGLTGDRGPVAAGQSWGANVVLTFAAEHRGAAALALVDGGWIWLGARFPTFEQCWEVLAPPVFSDLTLDELARMRRRFTDFPPEGVEDQLAYRTPDADGRAVARLTRAHHREILHSLWAVDPRPLFAEVTVPTLIAVPGVAPGAAETDGMPGPDAAARMLGDVKISRYAGAHHDLHAQHPDRLAAELLDLAARADGPASR